MNGDDTNQIVKVINLYALTVDTQRWELFDQVFTPDVDANCPPNGRWSDLKTLRHHWAAFHEPLDASTHTFTNHQVIVNGDRANALSYVIVRLIRQMPHGENYYESSGWYDDTLIRTAEGWRIRARLYGGNWWHGNPRVGGEGFDPTVMPLRRAAEAGMIAYLNALARNA